MAKFKCITYLSFASVYSCNFSQLVIHTAIAVCRPTRHLVKLGLLWANTVVYKQSHRHENSK